jgi:type VI secretion system protein ImpI
VSNRTAALTLVIINPTETGGGASIEHSFGTGGGSIGTAANDTCGCRPIAPAP